MQYPEQATSITPLANEDNNFLSRWSKRKVQVRQGVQPTEPAATPAAVLDHHPAAPAVLASVANEADAAQPTAEPLPTLADVAELSRDSNYARFLRPEVQPDVKNAALSKLFTDPHFNVMDGLDVYIDDYGKPDPLPASMLRQMLQAQVLGLFDDEDEKAKTADTAALPATASPPSTRAPADENTDLQLQPVDVAGCTSLEPSAVKDPGCPH